VSFISHKDGIIANGKIVTITIFSNEFNVKYTVAECFFNSVLLNIKIDITFPRIPIVIMTLEIAIDRS
jgi:hypothetical protein